MGRDWTRGDLRHMLLGFGTLVLLSSVFTFFETRDAMLLAGGALVGGGMLAVGIKLDADAPAK